MQQYNLSSIWPIGMDGFLITGFEQDIAIQMKYSISAVLILFASTYAVSLCGFLWTRNSRKPDKTAPTIPYYIPWLCHAFQLEWDMATFLATAVKNWGYLSPFKVQAGSFQFTMVTNPRHIRNIFRSSRTLTNRPTILLIMRKWFYTPEESMHHYASHNHTGTVSKTEDLEDVQASNSIRYLSGKYLLSVTERYLAILQRRLSNLDLPDAGMEISDFYAWLQSQVTPSVIEAMMGSRILEMYPGVVEDFWEFDRNIPNFSRGLPRWVIPTAYKTRDRLLANLKAWNQLAHSNSDCTQYENGDPEWDEFFGTKLIKAREDTMKKHGLDDDAIASANLGLLFGANSNAVPAVFWYIFEALKNADLQRRLKDELQDCMNPQTPGTFDITKFSTKPLLQSTYAEVLRVRVATGTVRANENTDFQLAPDYKVPRNMTMTIFSSITAHNTAAWGAARPQTVSRPLDEFWPERFLVQKESNKDATFTVEGLAECWMPYGGGQRMCPGRHFAKNEIIATLGLLLDMFECELIDRQKAEQVQPDQRRVPYGTLPPTRKVGVRIVRRGK